MSANYNTSLLRQLQSPLLASLRKMEEAVGRVVSGDLPASELAVTKEAHEVASGLSMIGRQAIARLAHGISKTIQMLAQPEAQGWDFIQTQTVARHLQSLIQAFSTHLQDMVNGGDELHVRLWPLWVEVAKATDQPLPEVEDLFEVDPDFEDVSFAPRPLAYLQSVVPGAYERLVAAIGLVEVARTDENMEQGLEKALEVFTQLYGMRHRRAYQTYWLVIRARISVGLIRGKGLLDERADWLALLRDAGIQMRKFGEDHRRLPPEKIRAVLLPLLKPWPDQWANAHPVLAELDRRLGLSVFWRAVEEIRQEGSAGAAAQFSLRQAEIEQLVRQCQTTWNRVVSSIPEQRRAATAAFLRSLGSVLGKREWFPGTMVSPLFDAFRGLGDHLAELVKPKEMDPVADYLALDVAASILLLEEIIERRVRWSQELEERILAQSHRLNLAVEGRFHELGSMPMVRWDRKWHERQVDLAVRQAIAQALVHADLIENSLADLFRGEDEEEIRARFDEFQARCRVVGLVLKMLRQPAAARLADGLREQIAKLSQASKAQTGSQSIDVTAFAQAMASLSRFLHARRNGDADALSLLAPGFDALWGEGAHQKMLEEMAQYEPRLVEAAPAPAPSQATDSEEDGASVKEVVEAPSAPPASPVDATPPRDLRGQLLGAGTWDTPESPGIVPIFLEEASEALSEIELARAVLKEKPRDEEAWASLRRQFHTLKGSGRIAGLLALGEVAWWVEERINEALLVRELYGDALDEAIGLAATRLSRWYAQVQRGEEGLIQPQDIRSALDAAHPVIGVPEVDSTQDLQADEGLNASEEDIQGAWGQASAASDEGSTQTRDPEGLQVQAQEDEPEGREESEDHENEEQGVGSDEEEALLPGLDVEMSRAIRKDAEERADELASVLIQFELNGDWDAARLHLSSHTLAALLHSAGQDQSSDAYRLARAMEDHAAGQLAAPSTPDEQVLAATDWLRRCAEALARGEPEPEAPPSQWFEALSVSPVEGEQEEPGPEEESASVDSGASSESDSAPDSPPSAETGQAEARESGTHATDGNQDDDWDLDLDPTESVDVLDDPHSSDPDQAEQQVEALPEPAVAEEPAGPEPAPEPEQADVLDQAPDSFAQEEGESEASIVDGVEGHSGADNEDEGVASAVEVDAMDGSDLVQSDDASPEVSENGMEEDLPSADAPLEPAQALSETDSAPAPETASAEETEAPVALQETEVEAEEASPGAASSLVEEEEGEDEGQEGDSARDHAWEQVFEAIDEIQAGFAKLSQALIELNDQDYRG